MLPTPVLGSIESALGIDDESMLTRRVTEAVWLKLPLTPVTTIGYVPGAVVLDVVTLISEFVTVGLGVKEASAPAGKPLTLKVTVPARPPEGTAISV